MCYAPGARLRSRRKDLGMWRRPGHVGGFEFFLCIMQTPSSMLNKLGHALRYLGEKTANAASWLGHKVGGGLAAISPAVAYFNPTIGAGLASAGMVLKGVGAVGDAGKAVMRGGDFNPHAIRRTVDGIRNDAGAVRSAYNQIRGAGNPLERGR